MPLILTLKIDRHSFDYFDELRRRYFPPERNFLAAHVTLFHHLPDENLVKIKDELRSLSGAAQVFPLYFTRWRFLGKGSAMTIESDDLIKLRAKLAHLWTHNLTAQDSQKFQPHITVQNKTAPDEARRLFEDLSADWTAKTGAAEGLILWHYDAPRWTFEEEFAFSR